MYGQASNISKLYTVKLACNETARNPNFSVAGGFRFMHVLEVRIPGTKHVFRYGEVSVMPSSVQDEFPLLNCSVSYGFPLCSFHLRQV